MSGCGSGAEPGTWNAAVVSGREHWGVMLSTAPAPVVWCALPRGVLGAGGGHLGHRRGLPCVSPFASRPRAAQRGRHGDFVVCCPSDSRPAPGCERAGGRHSALGVLLSLRPGAGPPSPLLLGCVPGPRGEATAWLHFGTSPGSISVSAAWVSPWFSPRCKARRSCRLQLSIRWSFVSLFFFFSFFLEQLD